MTSLRIGQALGLGALGLGLLLASATRAQAQAERKATDTAATDRDGYESLDALHQHYDKQFAELDRHRIDDLTRLAARQKGAEADATYHEIFNLAVARDAYGAAEKAAQTYLDSGGTNTELRAEATFIHAIARADQGHEDEALQDLRRFLQNVPAGQQLQPTAVTALGEAYLQHLIRHGRYDSAREVCNLFMNALPDPTLKQHFTARLARLDMLGKPAPAVEATDVDGQRISLAGLKGKVVLVDFWATWCPPCLAEMPTLNSLQARYGKDLAVVGVNLDAMHEGARDAARTTQGVRRFLLNNRVTFPNLMNDRTNNGLARAFGVTEIPANFLIDRDGKVIGVELTGAELQKAVEQAIKGETGRRNADAPRSK